MLGNVTIGAARLGCSFTADGRSRAPSTNGSTPVFTPTPATVTYNSSTPVLSINGSGLTASSFTGCFALVTSNASLGGTFAVTSM